VTKWFFTVLNPVRQESQFDGVITIHPSLSPPRCVRTPFTWFTWGLLQLLVWGDREIPPYNSNRSANLQAKVLPLKIGPLILPWGDDLLD